MRMYFIKIGRIINLRILKGIKKRPMYLVHRPFGLVLLTIQYHRPHPHPHRPNPHHRHRHRPNVPRQA